MTLASGTRLGPYEIVSLLGAGGMGEVYRARDPRLAREVAVKVLPEELFEGEERRLRFEREARLLAALNHPGIAAIYSFEEVSSTSSSTRHLLVMELVEGENLAQRISSGPLSLEESLSYARQVAGALEAAHEKGIVHRDLKPANVMVTRSGRTKILDFGLATEAPSVGVETLARTDVVLTRRGVLMGTPAYVSPEQLRGLRADARSDVFVFGAILYELLTGSRAFSGDTAPETFASILTREPPRPPTTEPAVSRLWNVVDRCLQKDPARRFPSARELAEALEGLANPVTSAPAAAPGAPSVAVLPFKDLLGDPASRNLGLGLADAAVTELASIPSLLVRPTAAILRFAGQSVDPQEAGRALAVDAVLDGSFQRAGKRLRVTVQLVETATGKSLWGGKIDTSLQDVFQMQDEVSRRIAEALQVRLSARGDPRAGRTQEVGGRAMELYMEGRVHLLREGLSDVNSAISCFQEAAASDPAFAPPLAGLADAYVRMALSYDPSGDWIERAEEACARALEKDPTLPEARYAKARLLWGPHGGWDHGGAMRELAGALAGRPSLNEAWGRLGIVLIHVGLLDESFGPFRQALAIDPADPSAALHRGLARYFQARFEEALEIASEGMVRMPSPWTSYQLALCQVSLGRTREAAATAEEGARLFPNDVVFHTVRGLLAALAGDSGRARKEVGLVEQHKRAFGHYHHAQHDVARIHALLGDKEEALRWLRDAASNGFPCAPAFEADPLLRPIRQEQAFGRLMSELRAESESYTRLYRELFPPASATAR